MKQSLGYRIVKDDLSSQDIPFQWLKWDIHEDEMHFVGIDRKNNISLQIIVECAYNERFKVTIYSKPRTFFKTFMCERDIPLMQLLDNCITDVYTKFRPKFKTVSHMIMQDMPEPLF